MILEKQKIEDEFENERSLLTLERKEIEEYKIKIQKMYIEVTKDNDRKVLNYVNELQQWKEREVESLKRETLTRKLDLEHKDFELHRVKETTSKQYQVIHAVHISDQIIWQCAIGISYQRHHMLILLCHVVGIPQCSYHCRMI